MEREAGSQESSLRRLTQADPEEVEKATSSTDKLSLQEQGFFLCDGLLQQNGVG